MERHRYDAWLDALTSWARSHPDVIGLVAVGSTAATSHLPDEHSDHDVFAVTRDGVAATLRDDLSWLPDSERIVMVHDETEHGRGVVYDDGHLVEIAVFDDHEMERIALNSYRVLVDEAELAPRLSAIAQCTTADRLVRDPDGSYRLHTFVEELIIGLGRHARGERVSANQRVRGAAASALAGLLGDHVTAEHPERLDNLDPHRRVEQAYPDLGARLADALDLAVPAAALELLAIAEQHLAARVPAATPEVFAAVRAVAQRAGG